MRPPWRAVGDDDVDRPQVRAQRCVEPSGTNGPKGLGAPPALPAGGGVPCGPRVGCVRAVLPLSVPGVGAARPGNEWRLWRGGAPLPIPNREVKPRSGDDTARERGKAARRPPTGDHPRQRMAPFFRVCPSFVRSLLLPLVTASPEKTISKNLIFSCTFRYNFYIFAV